MFEGVFASVINKFLGDYVDNLETSQFNVGVWKGDVVLRNLKLKKEALDKFNLPINVVEGYLGELTCKIPWHNLKNQPVRVYINNVYLLATPSGESEYNQEEEDERQQALKQEKLETAELLHTQPKIDPGQDDAKSSSFVTQLVTKIADNLQVSINNIHIRYEDKLSNAEHPFSVGFTLHELSASSTDENWKETFIDQQTDIIHKLVKLGSMAVYWNTETVSLAGKSYDEFVEHFTQMISTDKSKFKNHQFILKPVTGVGRIRVNKNFNVDTPKVAAGLLFEEFGFVFDDEQYRDMLLLANLFEYSMRQKKFQKYRPPRHVSVAENPRAWLDYAGRCVYSEIHERNRKWSWKYFAERRDQRKAYIPLYVDSKLERLTPENEAKLEALERILSFEDLRFYRSLAQSKLKKEKAIIAKQKEQEKPTGWLGGWFSGWSADTQGEQDGPTFTEEQKQELYETIDFDENQAEVALQLPKESVILSVTTQLKRGSLALKQGPHKSKNVIAELVFDTVTMKFLNRFDSFKAGLSLNGLNLYDGSTEGTLYPLLMRVQDTNDDVDDMVADDQDTSEQTEQTLEFLRNHSNPFFLLDYEHNPLDSHADDALMMKMQNLEVIYNPSVIDAVSKFLKPPVSSLESMVALMEAAGSTIEGLTQQTKAGLQFALEEHKTIDVKIDLNAPIFIFPENCNDKDSQVVVLDSGHIMIESDLVSKDHKVEMEEKIKGNLTEGDLKELENLMYDRFLVNMNSVQLLVGQNLESCLAKIKNTDNSGRNDDLHIVDRINMKFCVDVSIIPRASNITGLKISGDLPLLKINVSDTKYKALMRLIDLVLGDESSTESVLPQNSVIGANYYSNYNSSELFIDDDDEQDEEDEFFDAKDDQDNALSNTRLKLEHKLVEFSFSIDRLEASLRKADKEMKEVTLANMHLNNFRIELTQREFDMESLVTIQSLAVEDMMNPGEGFEYIITSETEDKEDEAELVRILYHSINPQSPEYMSTYEKFDQIVDISFSSVNIVITNKSILTLYDFLLATFVPTTPSSATSKSIVDDVDQSESNATPTNNTMKILARMKSINFILNDNGTKLSSISLLKGDAAVVLRDEYIRLGAKLGNISVSNFMNANNAESFKYLLTIQGEELADFRYETFPESGQDSSVYLRMGSAKLLFLEEPWLILLNFASKFAEMHGLFESARLAAAESAAQLQEQVPKMHFDIAIRSPIIVYPTKHDSRCTLTANLGEISATNTFSPNSEAEKMFLNIIQLEIKNIRLVSTSFIPESETTQSLQIIDDVDINLNVTYGEHIVGSKRPDTKSSGAISNIKINLTEKQYNLIFEVLDAITLIFGGDDSVNSSEQQKAISDEESQAKADAIGKSEEVWTYFEGNFTMQTVFLDIFAGDETQSTTSLCQFSLNDMSLDVKLSSDQSTETHVRIHSFVVTDSRPDPDNQFKEILPAVTQGGPQFVLIYRQTSDLKADANITVDSPKMILVLDQLFAIRDFFLSPFSDRLEQPAPQGPVSKDDQSAAFQYNQDMFTYNISVVNAEIILLADSKDVTSEAVIFSGQQLTLRQRAIMELSVNHVEVFLCRMDRREESTLRVIDNFDLIISMDDRDTSATTHLTNIKVDVFPLVTRISYRDSLLFMDIVDKAMKLLNHTNQNSSASSNGRPPSIAASVASQSTMDLDLPDIEDLDYDAVTLNSINSDTKPKINMKEDLHLTFKNLGIILVNDMNDLPFVDFQLMKCVVNATNWSSKLQLKAQVALQTNFLNIKNSHWEPLIEPWEFEVQVTDSNKMTSIESKKHLDVNLSHAFLEVALGVASRISDQSAHTFPNDRGTTVPYIIKNRTGLDLFIWCETEEDDNTQAALQKIANGDDVPWRFDDWRKARETTTVTRNRLNLQFENVPWESIKNIPVDIESSHMYVLRPKLEYVSHRLVCDVKLQGNTKIVTFRSPLVIENRTPIPMELIIVNYQGDAISAPAIVPPAEDYPVNIKTGYSNAIKIRPLAYDYSWSTKHLYWREFLVDNYSHTAICQSYDKSTVPFRYQVNARYDKNDPLNSIYPCMAIRLSSPFEIENLLPYDLRYRLVDKDNKQSWTGSLQQGKVTQVHTSQLDQLLLLSIQVKDAGYDFGEYSIIGSSNTHEMPLEDVLVMQNAQKQKLDLRIKRLEIPESGGSYRFSIYSPYVLINKTGRDIFIRSRGSQMSKISGLQLESENSDTKALPFMFSYAGSDSRGRVSIKIGDSEWSKPLSFEVVGSETPITLPFSSEPREIHLGMSVKQGSGKYLLSRVVTLTPRFILKNNMEESVNIRELASTDIQKLDPNQRAPLPFVNESLEKQLTIRFPGLNNKWSAPFNIEDIGKVFVKVYRNHGPTTRVELIRIDVMLQGASIFVIISKEKGKWPYRITNKSGTSVLLYQRNPSIRDRFTDGMPAIPVEGYSLASGESMQYAWDYPSLPAKSLILNIQGKEYKASLQEIGPQEPWRYPTPQGSACMAIDVFADGPIIELSLTKYGQANNVYRPKQQALSRRDTRDSFEQSISRRDTATRDSFEQSVSRRDTARESGFEIVEVDSIVTFTLHFRLEGIGISLINRNIRELVYASLRSVQLNYTESTVQTSVSLVIKWMQIDNQLYEALTPTILYPTFVSKSTKNTDVLPVFEAAIIKSKDKSHGVDYFKYCTFLLQEVSLETDEDFLTNLLDFCKFDVQGWNYEDESSIGDTSLDIPEPKLPEEGSQLFFEVIHIQPVKINISFSLSEHTTPQEGILQPYSPLQYVKNVLTMTIGDINDAPIKLNSLVMEGLMVSYPDLIDRLYTHYWQEIFYQFHNVIGSADFLGNPVGLFNTVSSGVVDFFYEPYQGLVLSDRPQDLGIGLAKGTASFLSKTVYGFSDSFSKFTGSLGKGLSAATLDKAFQERRRISRTRNKPRHALHGVTQGANSLASGFVSGISGVVTQPMAGAEKEGFGGFIKGFGKGLVGVVTKPVVGIFDAASNVTEGIRNTTTMLGDNATLDRIRLPRYIDIDGILRNFSTHCARGQYWLKEANDGAFANETYAGHLVLRGEETVALLSYTKVMVIRIRGNRRMATEWVVPFEELHTPIIENTGITLVLDQGQGIPGPFIPIPDKPSREWFYQRLETAIKYFDSERRPLE
ncbi:Vacuolar protein sorting-associated protein 13 [Basidiobolus ranarum]|uniref:Vacuolar protein sorting-associated protein 13 n=1 Tax=Basidiobolus ranarum TaxID=34480 RepID=A0ABR2WWW7_9FUNG